MQPTQTFGPYALHKRLAVGGMAEIFLAKHTHDAENRWFALKIMLPHNAGNAEHESMFMDEARLLQRIRHPNIVAAMDLLSIDNRVAVALEYVPGNDLSVVLKKLRETHAQAPIDIAIDIAIGIAAGLHHAHTLVGEDGNPLYLVHRDVTPENILLGIDGSVKVADFGVAKARGFGQVETKTGIIKGKLRYMAPEYATGNMQDVRSDIFSLGLCLFEMLTSRPAYNDDTPGPALVEAIKHATIPPVSTLRPDCPPILERLLFKALAVNPQDRFTTAEGMRRGLEKIRASVPDSGISLEKFLTGLGIGPAYPQTTPSHAAAPAAAPTTPSEPTRLPTDRAIALEPTGQMDVAASPPLRVRRPDIFSLTGYNRIVERDVKLEPRVAAVVEHQHPSKMSGLIDLDAFVEVEALPLDDTRDFDDDDDDADVETNRLAVSQSDMDRFGTTEPQPVLHHEPDAFGSTQPQPALRSQPDPYGATQPQPVLGHDHEAHGYAASPTLPEPVIPSSAHHQAVSLFDENEFVPPARHISGQHASVGGPIDAPLAYVPTLAHPPIQAPARPSPEHAPHAQHVQHVQPPQHVAVGAPTAPSPSIASGQALIPPTQSGHFTQPARPQSFTPQGQNPFGQGAFSQPGFNLNASPQQPGQQPGHPPAQLQQPAQTSHPAQPQLQPSHRPQPMVQQPLAAPPQSLGPHHHGPHSAGQPVQSVPSTGIKQAPGPPQPTQRGMAQPRDAHSALFLKLGIVGVVILVVLVVMALAIAIT